MTNLDALNEMRFWQVGSLAGRYFPVFCADRAVHRGRHRRCALGTGRALNDLALGDDLAVALGQNVRRPPHPAVRRSSRCCAAPPWPRAGRSSSSGSSCRTWRGCCCGPDYRWILPYSVILTPIVLLLADIIGRVVVSPGELQVGVVLGVLGAPAFIPLVRYRNLAEL